jgi:hypothetical protein
VIQWLLRLIGIAPKVAPERRRSLVARLKDPEPAENSTMMQAQASLERHARREQAIQEHKVEVSEEKARSDRERREHQTDISESTVSLEKVRRDTTRRRSRRMQLIDVSKAAREEARRRRESSG